MHITKNFLTIYATPFYFTWYCRSIISANWINSVLFLVDVKYLPGMTQIKTDTHNNLEELARAFLEIM